MRDFTQCGKAKNGSTKQSQQGNAANFHTFVSIACFAILSLVGYQVNAQAPTTQANNIILSPISGSTTSIRVTWTNGNGTGGRVVIITNATGTYTPANAATQAVAGTAFPADGAGADLDGDATDIAAAVYNGTGTTVDITGLAANTEYTVRVYEYNGSAATTEYLYATAAVNPVTLRYYTAASTSWTKPTGVKFVVAQVWGSGGGGGGTNDPDQSTGGGGGGAYASKLVDVTGAASFTATVGQPRSGGAGDNNGQNGQDSWFGSAATVMAKGGDGGEKSQAAAGVGGPGGLASASIGTTKFDGGDGGRGQVNGSWFAGPGGSSAGIAAAGTDAASTWSTLIAGAEPAGAGQGGNGGNSGNDGLPGKFPGGGGGGAGANTGNKNGGDSGGGLVLLSFTRPTAYLTYSDADGYVKPGQSLTITANFSEAMADAPVVQISLAGANVQALTNMTKVSATQYTYTYVVGAGNGTVTVSLGTGESTSSSNLIVSAPTTGATYNVDNVAPTAPTNPPTAAAGPFINAAEELAGVVIRVPLPGSGATAGDKVELLLGGSPFGTPIIATLTGTDISNTYADITIPTTRLGADGAKSITARVIDKADNLGAQSPALALTLDTGIPAATGNPTAALGPQINLAENGTFTIVVPGLTGTVANDAVLLFIGGSPFLTGAALAGGETSYSFTNVTLPGPDGIKSITAKLSDQAGNPSPANVTPLVLTLDTAPPSAPGNPTAAAGPTINIAENGSFTIVVPGFTGVAGDVVKLYLNAALFLTGSALAGGETSYSFTNVTLPGPDGAKNIRATITDLAGNEGSQNAADLALTLDITPPITPSTPTSAAAPTIDGAEYTAGFVVNVAGLGTAGTNDVVELLLGGLPFGTPLTNTLDAGEIAAGNINFTINCNQLGADGVGKLITAKLTDANGNPGTPSTALSLDLSTQPTAASTGPITFTGVTTTQATLTFTSLAGTGVSRIIVARQGLAVSFVPSPNTTYTANNDFAAAADQGGGNKIVGTASGNTITNLPSGDVVHFAVFEYNNCAGRENYFNTALTGSLAVAAGTASTVGTGSGAATISSLQDTQAEGIAAAANFSFIVDDDGATNGADAAPTRVTSFIIRRDLVNDQTTDWTATIGGLVFTDGTTTINSVANPANFTLNADDITITVPSALSTDLGYVADNATKTYSLKLWLKTSIAGLDIDNKRFVFTLANTDVATAATNSSGFAASTATSGTGNGQVQVIADRLTFTTVPPGGLQAGTDFTLVEAATDVNGNVDLNQTQQVTISAPTVPATGSLIATYATPSSLAQNMTAGRATWTGLKVTAGGNYTFRATDTDVAAPVLTTFTTGTINFTATTSASVIVKDPVFVEPATVDYKAYQHASLFTLASPPPAGAIEVGRFQIEDGPLGVDADDIGTTLTSITFNVTNPANLRFLGISPTGGNMVATVAATATSTMSGFSLLAEDTGNGGSGLRTFSVWASFDPNVTDNVGFQLTVSSVSTGQGGSTFAAPDGGGASTDGTANVVVVTADRLNIVSNPPATQLIGIAMPAVTVEATDILGSRDLDVDLGSAGLTSNGVLSTTPTAPFTDGFATYSSIIHSQTATTRTLTTTNLLGYINDTSTAFDLTASNSSDIIANAVFGYPQNIDYKLYPEASNLNLGNSLPVAQFIVRDGGAGGDLDGAPTNITSLTLSVTNSAFILRAALYDGPTELSEVVPSGGNLAFSGFNVSVGDDSSRPLTVRVSFTNAVVDNQQFRFTVTNTTTQALVSSTFNVPAAGSATSSILSDDNRIEVDASQLIFTQPFTTPLLASKDISAQQAVPVVMAVDINGVRDRDYGNNISIFCALPLFPAVSLTADALVPNSGVYTFPSNFRYTATGNGTLTLTAPGVSGVGTGLINVVAAQSTTITLGAVAPATISSLVNTSGGAVAAFNFNVTDDAAGPGPTDDGLNTLFTQVIIRANATNNDITDWTQALAGAILTDGVTSVNATAIGTNSITFGGLSTAAGQLGYVGDNATKNYSLKIYLKAALGGTLPTTIDNQQFEFQVVEADITPATNSTLIIAGQSATSGNRDVVTVVSTTLRFLYPTVPSTVSLDTDYPGVSVEAVDANANRDLDYNSVVRELSNVAGSTMINGPVINTTTFTAGLLNFNSTFQFTSGLSGANVTLTIKAGASTVCGPTTQCATSATLTLLSSFESIVMGDPTYSYSVNIPYVQHQEPSNISDLTTTSREISRMLLIDGSRTGFNYGGFLINTGTNIDPFPNGDEDGADTKLNSITFNITNPATLRRLALYSGSTELGEINVDALNIADGTPSQNFTFAAAPLTALVTATDNNLVTLSLRASFLSTAPEITDGDLITVTVASAVLLNGSNFFNSPPYVAGVNGGFQSPPGFNRLNVTATKLDFVTQPAPFAGKIETVTGAAIVHARDQFGVLDTDFNTLPSPGIVTSQGAANVLGSFGFTGGILNMNGLITYGNAGIGTLTVTAGGLSSLTNQPAATPPNVAIQCTRVDVIHVTTVRQDGGPGGVPIGPLDQVSLLAGASDQVLFGFTFNAPHTVTGPNHPRVSRFTFTFNNSISGIFNNIRVFESTTGQFSVATQVPSGNVTPGTQTIVDFSATPKDLTLFPNLTYFIMADVDPNVNGASPNMKVSIIDGGIGSPTQNNIQVVSNVGSQLSNTNGPTFNFAAVAPPTLVDTYPRIGQTNLDPTQPTLEMTFSVPVYSLDKKVLLYRKGVFPAPDVLVDTLRAANGFPFASTGVGAAKPLIFNIPPGTLAADNEYYVLIAAGNLSRSQGICDASRNLYPGISYPGTFFFRTAKQVAPNLLGSGTVPAASAGDPTATDITNSGATINATFDNIGKAYYLVCSNINPTTPPTNAEIISGVYPAATVVGSGQFDINATHTISQFGNFSVPGGFIAGTHYVWVTAESYAEKQVGGVITRTSYPASSPYGSTAFGFAPIGGAITGPTFNFPAPGPSATPSVTTNNVTVSMCSNSWQVLNTPIIIYEGTNAGQTFTSPTPDQTVNIVLPAGFQFDDAESSPGVPLYGKVDLVGADFVGAGSISYLSSSVLRITFTNFGAFGSKDKIVLRDLRIRSEGSRTGDIFRLGGLGIPAINDGTRIASLSAQEAPIISFDNSYSLSLGESWAATTFSETAIPDNAVPSLVSLIPYIPNAFDFGPTIFSGQGVNINTLNVKGVTLDVPFNITVTHKDQNGCISDNPVQFVVYDDARAIIITKPGKVNPPGTIPATLDQGPYCSSIPTFQINQLNPSPAIPGVERFVTYDNLEAYYLENLVAGIPATSVAGRHIINGTDFGGAWNAIVAGLPQVVGSHPISGRTYLDYKFDDKQIVNAHAISGGVIDYVYENFDVDKTPSTPGNYPGGNITYYNGGSLGFVEFTGTYRNIANPIVKINRRQLVEFYVPAVPAVELVTPYSDLILNDPANPPSNIANPNNINNPGTFVFCEAGGLITINGWPKAEPSQGTQGVFKIYNASVGGAQIMTGLTDFGTSIAQIDPTDPGIKNGNNNIRIEYEYRDANSPNGTCTSIGTQIIRISPNPTAIFTQVSLASPFVDATNPTAYCEGKPIRFDASASSVSGGGATIKTYTWLFDDATNSVSSNPNGVSGLAGGLAVPGSPGPPPVPPVPAAGTNDFPVHYYKAFGTYNPSLVITSNFNCRSVPATLPVKVGGIPDVKMVLDGTHAGATPADAFHFQSNNSVISANDHFKRLDIDYGDASAPGIFSVATPSTGNDPLFNAHVFTHNYASTGQKVYDFKITTEIGCVNSLSLNNTIIKGISVAEDQVLRTLVVLPRFQVTPANAYLETFEPATFNANQIWQTWYTGAFTPTPIPPAVTPNRSIDPSWQLGVPVGKFTPTVNGTTIWTTKLSGTYSSGERSAIYSPSFDLSALSRPMVSFDTYTQLEPADGVVLQYSIDNKNITDPTKVWKVLGTETDGEYWYTDRGIAAKPGDQVGNDYGWSTKNNDKWLSSRHALVDAGTSLIINDPRVVFRLALGSAATSISGNGFGFDNVRIGERTRTILLESFANAANTTKSGSTPVGYTSDEQYESEVIAGFNASLVGLEVVKLHYRVNFPGNDPLNRNNPGDPSSRALFYGVDRTPAARLDGYAPTPYEAFSIWGVNTFNTRTLRLAQAALVIRPETGPPSNISSTGKIKFYVDVTPTVDLDSKTILHLGVVEQLVPLASLGTSAQDIKTGESSFEYVVKKLLPSASGTRTSSHPNAVGGVLVAPLAPAPPITYTFGPFEWTPELNRFYAPSTGDLGVIAFLQREDGDKEVYQAEIVLSLDDPPSSLVTGVEPMNANDVKVYPNPANREVTVQLPGQVTKAAAVSLIDQTGRVTLQSTIPEGSDRKTLNVSDLSGGVYILTIDMGQGVLTRKKVMVLHQD